MNEVNEAEQQRIEIDLLHNHSHLVEQLVAWFESEWAPYYGPGMPGDARHDIEETLHREGLPLALVALDGARLVGTAALRRESVTTHPQLTPWLAALLVSERYRRRGIAESLVGAIEDRAREMGFPCIYTGANEIGRMLLRRGWEFIERVPYYVSDVSIYRKSLTGDRVIS